MQLNWVFDEFFVRTELWEEVFRPMGIDCIQVLNSKGTVLESVVQLEIRDVVEIETGMLAQEEVCCTECSRPKYLDRFRGAFPRMLSEPHSPMVKTVQQFGSGGQVFRAVLISNELYQRMVNYGVRGCGYTVVEER